MDVSYIKNWTFITNRVKRLLPEIVDISDEYLSNLSENQRLEAESIIKSTVFTYVDTYGGVKRPIVAGRNHVQVLERQHTDYMSDKLRFGQIMTELNLNEFYPKAYTRLEDAIREVDTTKIPILYNKLRSGTVGKQVNCVRSSELEYFSLKPHHVLQECVTDPLLYNNKKLEFRFFVLIHNKEIHLSNMGFAYVHTGGDFDPNSTDWLMQVKKVDGVYIGREEGDGEVRVMPMDEMSENDQFFDALTLMMKGAAPALEAARQQSDENKFTIMGCDAIPKLNGTTQLLELNTYPNFVHVDHYINQRVNMRVFSAVLLKTITKIDNGTWIKIV